MIFPNEIVDLILKFLQTCPDYMVVRQINRHFRSICLHHRHERRLIRMNNNLRAGHPQLSFDQFLDRFPGTLRLRFIKTINESNSHYLFPIATVGPQFSEPFLWNNFQSQLRYGDYVWGFLTSRNRHGEKHSAEGELVIAKVHNSRATECLFSMDVSVPRRKLCQDMYSAWEEYNESSSIPYKYITFASSCLTGHDTAFGDKTSGEKDDDLIRLVDVPHYKRLDIYIKWINRPVIKFPYHVVVRSFSKYGTLIIGFYTEPIQFLIIGQPQYIHRKEMQIDKSRLLEYFAYIVTSNLFTLVTCPASIITSPAFWPLPKKDWFAGNECVLRIPPQCNDAPTYQEFLRSKPSQGNSHQTLKFRATLTIDKQSLHVEPDFTRRYFESCENSLSDNNFLVGRRPKYLDYEKMIIDVRPRALDFLKETKKFKTLKFLLPSSEKVTYTHYGVTYTHYDKNYIYFRRPYKDPGLDCYKIELVDCFEEDPANNPDK